MNDPWADILDEDETILWRGRSTGRSRIRWESPINPFFFVIFAIIAVVWTFASNWGGQPVWWLGLIVLVVFLWRSGWVNFPLALRRRARIYAMSNKRAFVAVWRRGRCLLYTSDAADD